MPDFLHGSGKWGGKLPLFSLLCLCLRLHIAVVFPFVIDDDSNRYLVFVEKYIMTHYPVCKIAARISVVSSEYS